MRWPTMLTAMSFLSYPELTSMQDQQNHTSRPVRTRCRPAHCVLAGNIVSWESAEPAEVHLTSRRPSARP